MAYTLGQAARATGRSKPTVLRAIKLGRISAVKGPQGNWQIEPVELHRVYPPLLTAERQTPGEAERYETSSSNTPVLAEDNRHLRERLEEKDRLIEDMRSERDRWRDESDSWRRQAQSLLTDQSPRLRRRWWWFWLI